MHFPPDGKQDYDYADTQTVLTPGEYKTGDVIFPYEKSKN